MEENVKIKISKWFDEKWQNKKCSVCNKDDWTLAENFVTTVNLDINGIQLGGNIYPQVAITCANCGNTKYFNAVVMDVFK